MSDDFDEYDMDNIDNEVARYQPPERPSERARARKLVPLIARMIAQRHDLKTAAVRRIIDANRRSGPLQASPTFDREFGKICDEERDRHKPARPNDPTRNRRKPMPTNATAVQPVIKTPLVQSASTTPAMSARTEEPPVPSGSAKVQDTRHPRDIHAGTFGGKVYVHGREIRAFFKAVEDGADDVALVRLARAVMADAPSRANLVQLHERDRAVLDAALLLP